MTAAEQPLPVNLARMDEVTGGDKEFSIELIDLFLTDSADIVERLWSQLDGENLDLFRRETHKLKGSASNLGANGLAQLAGELENQSRVSNKSELRDALNQLVEEFDRVRNQLEDYREVLRSNQ